MAILKVARMGHPVLRQIAAPIDPREITGPEIQRLVRDMLETMLEYNGVGLAAPQVHVPRRLVLCGGGVDKQGDMVVRVLINPEIKTTTTAKAGMWEGCLSVPGLRGYVERPSGVDVKAYDEKGERVAFSLSGYPAVVMQHECDHLDGVLFVDKLKDPRLFAYEEEGERFLDLARGEGLAGEDDDEDDEEDTEEAGVKEEEEA